MAEKKSGFSIEPIILTNDQQAQVKIARASWQCPAGHACLTESTEVLFLEDRTVVLCGRRGGCVSEAYPSGGP